MRYWLPNMAVLGFLTLMTVVVSVQSARKRGVLREVVSIIPNVVVGAALVLGYGKLTDGSGTWRTLHPQKVYRAWWAEVERCTGRSGDFDAVQWRVVADKWWRYWVGKYGVADTAIYLEMSKVFDESTVKHEMIHALGIMPYGHVNNAFERCAHRPDREKKKGRTDA